MPHHWSIIKKISNVSMYRIRTCIHVCKHHQPHQPVYLHLNWLKIYTKLGCLSCFAANRLSLSHWYYMSVSSLRRFCLYQPLCLWAAIDNQCLYAIWILANARCCTALSIAYSGYPLATISTWAIGPRPGPKEVDVRLQPIAAGEKMHRNMGLKLINS